MKRDASREAIRMGIMGYAGALTAMADAQNAEHPLLEPTKIEVQFGPRYAKIVKVVHGGQRSVHSFVDRYNGDILKAASWRAPAKHPRGNVLEEDFGVRHSGASVYGVRYL